MLMSAMSVSAPGAVCPTSTRSSKIKDSSSRSGWQSDSAGVSEPTPIIVDAALDTSRPCEICQATLDLFVDILGAEAGNLALKVLATGGVYLGGGIPPRILSIPAKWPLPQGVRAQRALWAPT